MSLKNAKASLEISINGTKDGALKAMQKGT